MLVGSFLGMAATMLLMAAALALPALAPLAPVFSVVGTVLYISSFALGVGPIPAIMTGELLCRTHARHGRLEPPKRLVGRGWPEPGAA